MTIAASITSELTSLQLQVQAASPLAQAPRATLIAIKLNAAQLVGDLQAALDAPSPLDSFAAPTDPASIAAGVLSVAEVASDQSSLSLMRGVAGRAASNINQIPS
jgi:hypothetical protein